MRRIGQVDALNREEPAVIYCDNHVLVAVKPANMPSQADSSGDPDMFSLMKEYVRRTYRKQGNVYLGLLHRLDRPVGGLMAFARTSKAAARLSEQLRTHTMKRDYRAVVTGETQRDGQISDWLIWDGTRSRVTDRRESEAKEARLTYRRLAVRHGLSLLEISLETGRKHQIRAQLANAGFPIWGDQRYGNGRPGEQIALWGVRLTFIHPTTKKTMVFETQTPDLPPWNAFGKEQPPVGAGGDR